MLYNTITFFSDKLFGGLGDARQLSAQGINLIPVLVLKSQANSHGVNCNI